VIEALVVGLVASSSLLIGAAILTRFMSEPRGSSWHSVPACYLRGCGKPGPLGGCSG